MKSHLRVCPETGWYVESKENAICNLIEDINYAAYYIKSNPYLTKNTVRCYSKDHLVYAV